MSTVFQLLLFIFFVSIFHKPGAAPNQQLSSQGSLRFIENTDGSFSFHTGLLSGTLRQKGKSTGLVPVTYVPNKKIISMGEGLFNHYRVFSKGKRYGYGARRWPSSASLGKDGSVEVFWPATEERPFELRANYRWVSPNTLDLVTQVQAQKNLPAFEVFLAAYFSSDFVDSQVSATRHPRQATPKSGFVSADRELGDWLAFPRDQNGTALIRDGRWALEPHPLQWTMMPNFDRPLAIRRDPESGLTVLLMSQREDCFGVFTPYGKEKHYSNYMSLFGLDLKPGESAQAHSRLVVLPDFLSRPAPGSLTNATENIRDKKILSIADTFLSNAESNP